MQAAMNYSLLVWDNVKNIPFPEEVKTTIANVDWSKYEWHVVGLPLSFAKYSLSDGKTLYLEEFPLGIQSLNKEEYTGDVAVASYFIHPDKNGDNFLVGLRVTLLKGEVVEVTVEKIQRQSNIEYQEQLSRMQEGIRINIAKYNSWWFRWLYKPWAWTVRLVATIIIYIFKICAAIVGQVAFWLTPL